MHQLLRCVIASVVVATALPAAAQRNPFADAPPQDSQPAEPAEPAPTQPPAAEPTESEAPVEPVEVLIEEPTEPKVLVAEPQPEPPPTPEPARATSERLDRVPLTSNYSKVELITTAVALPVGLGLAIGGPSLFGEPNASMTAPRLGSIDYNLSIKSHGNLREGSPFAFGIFDVTGVVLPAAIGTFYLASSLNLWLFDQPMLRAQSSNIDHSLIGIAQTAGWTALTSGVARLLVGRERPYAAFNRSGYGSPDDPGANLSFVSTATAMSFALSSFAARDLAGWAKRNDVSFVVGAVLPHALLYGFSATVGFSAIYGQQHYFSDIAISAVLGSLIGNLAYVAHFDGEGNPRERHREQVAIAPTLLHAPSGEARVGLGVGTRF